MNVVHIQRKRPQARFSIEGYFDRVRRCLTDDVPISVYVLPCFSRGFLRRFWNLVATSFHQGDVNHVTGDVHYVTLLLSRRRTILTVHDCEILNRLSGWKRFIVRLFWYTLPVRRVAWITVNSEETKRRLLEVVLFPADRIKVVPVSVSAIYQPSAKKFEQECPRILHIGTKENKNLLRVAEALAGLDCELHIVGPLSDVQTRILEAHRISYCNHLYLTDEQLADQYRKADVISFVSTYEGFGMPIVEAQSIERVCVTSNCSSMPEVAGRGACFVDPFDVASIRAGFQRVITDAHYREALIAFGRENRNRFDSQKIAFAFLELYSSVYASNV